MILFLLASLPGLFCSCDKRDRFDVPLPVPTVTAPNVSSTINVTSITATSAVSGGVIANDGGSPITVKGVCWSISPNPTTTNFKTTDGTGTATFSSTITGLTGGTMYYVRAYATNNFATAYGNQVAFVTP